MSFSISGYDLEHDQSVYELNDDEFDEIIDNPIPGQKYRIQFWPAVFGKDEIIKQTSVHAEHIHNTQPISSADYSAVKENQKLKMEKQLKKIRDDGTPWWKFW